ncbi:unnamed protein product [Rotaria sordida]|uniref:Alpha/beta hydrolase fold-3 domain-containing protein n=1 Tax=Rotaria sordida TaxID=392033 RepID=A0A815YS08_9BILA|nr:unnamed protein product [Rotaria sordida]CAF1575439.1 unnamed protein product [Rotaria sordida]
MGDDQALVASWLHEESTWQQQFRGWDFSQLTSSGRISFNMSEEQLGWDYTKIICQTVAQLADSDDENKSNEIYLLDLGTGGGEYLEGILARLPSNEKKLIVYATESYEPNFQLAKQRLTPYGVTVIQSESDSLNSLLPFTDDGPKFDLIISRHTCYNIREVDRLLKFKTGIFITQQVDGTSGQDLIELFDHQPQWPFFTLAYASLTLKNQAPSMKLIRAQESETKDPRFNNETLAFLQFLSQNPPPQDNEVEKMRLYMDGIHQKINKKLHETFKGTIEEKIVKTNSTEIPITIYTPLNVNKDKLVIYFHGGEYRLGPEYKYPIWLDDALEVTQHIIQNRTAYGVNKTAKIGVAGDSAGGMISASLSHLLKGIDFQILIYAALDILGEMPSYKEFTKPMYFLTPEFMKWFTTHAFHNLDEVKDPRVSVLLNRTFKDLPPCLFIVADLDILRDGNLEYQKLLEKAGVQTKLVLMKDVIHVFFTLPGIFPQSCAEAVDAIRDFMASI